MNVIKMELRRTGKSLLIWSLSLSGVTFFIAILFSGFSDAVEPIKVMLNSLPQEMLESMGIDADLFVTFPGYFSYIIGYIAVAISIFAMQRGQLITGEEKTLGMSDFIYTKPISRVGVVLSKYVAVVIQTIVVTAFVFIISLVMNYVYKGEHIKSIVLIFIAILLTGFFFIALGAFISTVLKQNKSMLSISMAVVFSLFFLTMIQRIFSDTQLSYFSPFSQLDISQIVMQSAFEIDLLAVNIVCTVLFFTASLVLSAQENLRR